MKQLVLILASVLFTNYLLAATYYVNVSRPDDSGNGLSWDEAKKTIQAAVDMTVSNDLVLVTNGVYNSGTRVNPGYSLKNRVVITNDITVRSVNGPVVTIIEGSGMEYYGTTSAIRCVYMTSGVLDGFTLEKGATLSPEADYFDFEGGGVTSGRQGKGTIKRAILKNNMAWNGGAVGEEVALESSLLMDNLALDAGGAGCAASFLNCTITRNSAGRGSGTWACSVNNCIVWGNGDNSSNYGEGCVEYSCTTPLPTGAGNINADPQFVDAANNNFRLNPTSPCINTGKNGILQTGLDLDENIRILEGSVDMGAYESELTRDLASLFGLTESSTVICGSANNRCFVFDGQSVQIKGSLLGDDKSSGFTFTPQDQGRLTFLWNVSSEYYFDTLSFYVDDVLTAQISGKNVTWRSVTNTITSEGLHTFKWEYAKDADTSVGQDCAWIADVVWKTATESSGVPVPFAWLNQYPALLSLANDDYEAMALADADGDGHAAWQEYVAGSIPTNRESVLRMRIDGNRGSPHVTWTPDLGTARVYSVAGKTNLAEGAWGATNGASRFFRVKVALP